MSTITNYLPFVNSSSSKCPLSQLGQSLEYHDFRSQVPLRRIVVDEDGNQVWSIYDTGPRTVSSPIIFFPPVSGMGEIFFQQLQYLSSRGVRAIAVSYPTYWSYREFTFGFIKLLDSLRLTKVHVFGASLGGFLAQKVAETWNQIPRIQSVILCNSFGDTSIFRQGDTAHLFWMMPGVVLKKMIFRNSFLHDPYFSKDSTIKDSMVFVAESLNRMSQTEVASRLTLNCTSNYIEPHRLTGVTVTILDVFDRCALSQKVREEMYKMYPEGRRAHLKTGGNFPYLSRADEVNMHILIHLRMFGGTRYSAFDESDLPTRKEDVFEDPSLHLPLNGGLPSNNTTVVVAEATIHKSPEEEGTSEQQPEQK